MSGLIFLTDIDGNSVAINRDAIKAVAESNNPIVYLGKDEWLQVKESYYEVLQKIIVTHTLKERERFCEAFESYKKSREGKGE